MISPASVSDSATATATTVYSQLHHNQIGRSDLYVSETPNYDIHHRRINTSHTRLSPSAESSPATPTASVATPAQSHLKDPYSTSVTLASSMHPTANTSSPHGASSTSTASTPLTIPAQYPQTMHQAHYHQGQAYDEHDQPHQQLLPPGPSSLSQQHSYSYPRSQHSPNYQEHSKQQHQQQYRQAYQMPPPRSLVSSAQASIQQQQQQRSHAGEHDHAQRYHQQQLHQPHQHHIQNRQTYQSQPMHTAAPSPANPHNHLNQQQQHLYLHSNYRQPSTAEMTMHHGSFRSHPSLGTTQPQMMSADIQPT
ncbi:hypothetical protein GGI05_002663, partial [Coemansia sp. RSA 2603]